MTKCAPLPLFKNPCLCLFSDGITMVVEEVESAAAAAAVGVGKCVGGGGRLQPFPVAAAGGSALPRGSTRSRGGVARRQTSPSSQDHSLLVSRGLMP